ncbi:hypothetical protein AB0C24_02945 [Amycolatopsis japonica]|uniref:hypothetical protein n=1 Tax=Amycolatopsis japonica TaxID=208439 RepID=UPI003400AC57
MAARPEEAAHLSVKASFPTLKVGKEAFTTFADEAREEAVPDAFVYLSKEPESLTTALSSMAALDVPPDRG